MDGEVRLPESAAIMAYLAALYQLPEQWHPATAASSSTGKEREAALQRRATFDAATHWQHLTVRRGCMTYAFATVIGGWAELGAGKQSSYKPRPQCCADGDAPAARGSAGRV